MGIEKALKLYANYKLDESRKILEGIIKLDSKNIDALVIMGKIYSREQNYRESINCFNKVIELDTNNQDAIVGLKLIANILKLSNNYYFENPYTDDDLYDFNK